MDAARQLKAHAPDALRERLAADGFERYRADQVAAWLYARGVEDPRAMTDLPSALRERLAARWESRALELDGVERSQDGTVKGRLRARDGAVVEAVMIPEQRRHTLCVSTQVGCPLACSFCATGAMGLRRNLGAEEIIDQVCRMREVLPPGASLSHVVFMGMGEPLLNLPAVIEAVRTLLHPRGFHLAPRRVTVSTAGLVPRIAPLLEAVPVNLAVSLHATTNALRDELVPLNRRFPLEVLLGTLRELGRATRRRPIFFEYTLMAGRNDSVEDARRLVQLVRDIPCKVNLIPMNAHPDSRERPPAPDVQERFQLELLRRGLRATLRRPRGDDVAAACGQLALRPSPDSAAAPPSGW